MDKKKKQKAEKPAKRFAKVYKEKTDEESRGVLLDRATGVHYLLIQNGIACAVTPLLDGKGKVVIEAPEEAPEEKGKPGA